MSNREGEVREVPFLKNDMKSHVPATGKPLDRADSPGKADAECGDQEDAVESKDGVTIIVDPVNLDRTSGNTRRRNIKGDHYAKNL